MGCHIETELEILRQTLAIYCQDTIKRKPYRVNIIENDVPILTALFV